MCNKATFHLQLQKKGTWICPNLEDVLLHICDMNLLSYHVGKANKVTMFAGQLPSKLEQNSLKWTLGKAVKYSESTVKDGIKNILKLSFKWGENLPE